MSQQHDQPGCDPGAIGGDADRDFAVHGDIASEDVMAILASVEQQFDRLRDAQAARADEIAAVARRSTELEERAQDVDRRARELEAARAELARVRGGVEEQAAALRQAQGALQEQQHRLEEQAREQERRSAETARHEADLEAARAALREREAQVGQADQLRRELEELRAKVEQTETEAIELIQQAEQERDAHKSASEARLEEMRQQLQRARTELESNNEQLRFRREQIDQLNRQLAQREEELQTLHGDAERQAQHTRTLERQLHDSQHKLDVAGQKLRKFAEMLGEQAPQLDRGAAALAMLEQQKRQIEKLTQQLAEARVSADPDELRRRDERITELTEALRQSRGQAAGQPDAFELEQRTSEMMQELDRVRLELEQAQMSATEAREQLERHLKERSAAEQAGRRFEIEREELLARITQSEERRRQLESEGAAAAQREREFRERIRAMEGEIESSRDHAVAPDAALEAERRRLAEESRRLEARAAELRQREERLEPAGEEASHPSAQTLEDVREIQRAQAQLTEVHRQLARAERRMAKRWARARALTQLAALSILIAFNAVAAWLAADMLFPAVVVASATVQADAQGPALTPEEAAAWQRWHAELLLSSGFQARLATTMAERRIDAYATPVAVANLILRDVKVDTSTPGAMVLTLARPGVDEAARLLDVITATLLSESKARMADRDSRVFARCAAERESDGRTRYAIEGAIPLEDHRLVRAGPIFGGSMAVSLALFGIFYMRLVRAKRVFDEEEDIFAADEFADEDHATLKSVPLAG
jgi:hypothetical protein